MYTVAVGYLFHLYFYSEFEHDCYNDYKMAFIVKHTASFLLNGKKS